MGNRTTPKSGATDNDEVWEVRETASEEAGQTSEDKTDNNVIPMEDDPVKYDVEALTNFIDTVFHVEQYRDSVFVQVSPKAPKGFGLRPEKIFPRLKKTEAPMRGYFSTSTLDLTDGDLRHTKTAFKAYHGLVLDDIGTKIDESTIPEDMAPNYVIESSENNFQWGYILAEPITDYDEAQLFIDLFVDAGMTDGGGAMPVKKVRLPCGVNGKVGPKGSFKVRLVGEMDPKPWGTQELLDAAGIDVDWEAYRKTATDRNRRARRIGVTAWNPDIFHHNPATGVFDPVLEFLASKGMVIQEAQEPFMDIICPFHDQHSETDLQSKLCGYSPLGHGMYPASRKFHCFHDACRDRTQQDYLNEVHHLGGPLLPEHEFAPEDVVHMVYDNVNDKVFNLRERGALVPRTVVAVNRTTPKIRLPNGSMVEQLPLWLKQPSSVVVSGATFDPSTRDRLIEDAYGDLRANLFHMPDYDPVAPDPEIVKVFMDYLTYLLPDDDERAYFIKWLACKVQNPAFRGAAIILISQAQGTGKNTLMKMLAKLFGPHNTDQMNIESLLDSGNQFNEWSTKLFVNVNESLAVGENLTARRAYNRLKEIVDPMTMQVMVNPKYGAKYIANCATSFLFFSNHSDAVYLQAHDRRFFAARGPDIPADPEYFGMVHKWLEGENWMAHIWWHFMDMTVDLNEMMAKPAQTLTMLEIKHDTTSPLEAVIMAAICCWPSALVPRKVVKELLRNYVPRGVPENYHGAAERLISDRLMSLRSRRDLVQDRICKVSHGLRDPDLLRDPEGLKYQAGLAKQALQDYSEEQFRVKVDQWLEDRGFDF